MIRRNACLLAMLLLAVPLLAFGQTPGPADHQTPAPRVKRPPADPSADAALRQSGLSEAQARTLLSDGGYAGISDLHAEPNSIWIWQADAMRNGRRVRLGIDYRGNVTQISPGLATPCTSPGVNLGVGGFRVGPSLSEVTGCTGR
jgi:hypothetical protein